MCFLYWLIYTPSQLNFRYCHNHIVGLESRGSGCFAFRSKIDLWIVYRSSNIKKAKTQENINMVVISKDVYLGVDMCSVGVCVLMVVVVVIYACACVCTCMLACMYIRNRNISNATSIGNVKLRWTLSSKP